MGILIGLLAGTGLFCVWWACWVPAGRREPRWRGPGERARDLLVQADLASVGPGTLVVTASGLALTVFIGALAASGVPAIAASFALFTGWAPFGAVLGRARRRRERWRNLWPEVVDNLASGVRAGLSLPEALGQVGDRGPGPLRPPFADFARQYRVTGNFDQAVGDLKDRLADPVGDRLCEALRITREVGGSDLGRLLRSLSAFLREDARARSELEARQSWTVSAARLAVAAPWIVLALLATRPEAVSAYSRPAGALVLLTGGVTSMVAYRLMVFLGRLPEETRALR